jgi:hypothetical protein
MSAFAAEPSPGTAVAEAVPRPRRRWLRFSLRTLMIAVTLFCVAAGVVSSNAMRQKRAVERIKSLRAVAVYYDYQLDGKLNPHSVEPVAPGPDWLRNLLGVDYFATVTSVRVNVGTDEFLEAAADLPHLRDLRIACDSKITDHAWEHLKELNELESLYLRGIHDSGMTNLRGLTQLRTLYITGTDLTGAGLENLQELTQLGTLNLTDTKVTDAGLASLKGLTQLRRFQLWKTEVTDDGVKDLKKALPGCQIPWSRS